MACGYSKLEALDADYNSKIIFQIGPSYPGLFGHFLRLGNSKLKTNFGLVSASQASSFEYPHAILFRNVFFDLI